MNMKWISRSTVFAVLLCIVALSAQAQMQTPKPSPELKKLDYFVGDWKTDATMTPGGKFAASDHSEWLGEFFLINHSKFTSPFGPGTEVEIMSYDPVGKVYSYDSFSSSGRHEIAKGTLDGDTWTWTSDLNMGGQSMKSRFVEHILSPVSYHFVFQMSPDGATWSTVMEGTATKEAATERK